VKAVRKSYGSYWPYQQSSRNNVLLPKTRVFGLPFGEKRINVGMFFVEIIPQCDKQRDRQTVMCIAIVALIRADVR